MRGKLGDKLLHLLLLPKKRLRIRRRPVRHQRLADGRGVLMDGKGEGEGELFRAEAHRDAMVGDVERPDHRLVLLGGSRHEPLLKHRHSVHDATEEEQQGQDPSSSEEGKKRFMYTTGLDIPRGGAQGSALRDATRRTRKWWRDIAHQRRRGAAIAVADTAGPVDAIRLVAGGARGSGGQRPPSREHLLVAGTGTMQQAAAAPGGANGCAVLPTVHRNEDRPHDDRNDAPDQDNREETQIGNPLGIGAIARDARRQARDLPPQGSVLSQEAEAKDPEPPARGEGGKEGEDSEDGRPVQHVVFGAVRHVVLVVVAREGFP
mmetsp:Transcript_128594/g.274301  ORF Transcript_128594/g.274301 Transcript_128594/m.274301 type:complete len:319 (+) Transcript_128594:312-1268(+)